MPIDFFPTAGAPATLEFLATEDTIEAIDDAIQIAEDCSFCLVGCDKDIPQFAYLADADNLYRNDFSSYIKEVPLGGSITGTLIQVSPTGVETEYTIIDDTYGTFYALDVMRLNTWGFILDWYKVANLLGFSKYKFNILIKNVSSVTILDQTIGCYNLKPYSCIAAHGTTRTETEQSGYIEDGFDYRGLVRTIPGPSEQQPKTTWPQQFRWYGKFIALTPTLLQDVLVDSQRNSLQVQTQIVDNYQLTLRLIQVNLSKHYIKDYLLANSILISDYNRNNQELYFNVRVSPVEISDRITSNLNKNEFFTINLEEYTKDTLKRN